MKQSGTTYPYEWYAYRNAEIDKCPECGNLPRDYHVPLGHIAKIPQVEFECVYGHKWKTTTTD